MENSTRRTFEKAGLTDNITVESIAECLMLSLERGKPVGFMYRHPYTQRTYALTLVFDTVTALADPQPEVGRITTLPSQKVIYAEAAVVSTDGMVHEDGAYTEAPVSLEMTDYTAVAAALGEAIGRVDAQYLIHERMLRRLAETRKSRVVKTRRAEQMRGQND